MGYEDADLILKLWQTNFELRLGYQSVQNNTFFGHDKEDPTCSYPFLQKDHLHSEGPQYSFEIRSRVETFWDKMPRECLKYLREQVQSSSNTSYGSCLPMTTKEPSFCSSPACTCQRRSWDIPGKTVTNIREDLKGITTREAVLQLSGTSNSYILQLVKTNTDGDNDPSAPFLLTKYRTVQPPVGPELKSTNPVLSLLFAPVVAARANTKNLQFFFHILRWRGMDDALAYARISGAEH
ncbi:hypothetical protein Tco_0795296 [Tanacetum coccineum]